MTIIIAIAFIVLAMVLSGWAGVNLWAIRTDHLLVTDGPVAKLLERGQTLLGISSILSIVGMFMLGLELAIK